MRPLKLTLSAFGNYANKQTIDFSKLNGKNIFLITGKTGAGKTTIFDAISYALYGAPSGDFRDTASLRSHYVDSDVETFVELEFQLRDKLYKIRRSPEQFLKKKRGEGDKKEGAKVELTFLDGIEKSLTKVNDVNERINELLGVDKDQFRQIVMLPQGEFLKLLKETSKDREEIFRKIFGTEGFKRIQDKLREKVKKLDEDLRGSKREKEIYAKQIKTEESSLLYSFINANDIFIERVLELTLEQIENDNKKSKELELECNDIRNQIKNLDRKISELDNNKKLINDYEKSFKELGEHKKKLNIVSEYEVKLSNGRKAEKVKVIENKLNLENDNKKERVENLTVVKENKVNSLKEKERYEKELNKAKERIKEKERLIVKINDLKKKEDLVLNYIGKREKINLLENTIREKEDLLAIKKLELDKKIEEEKDLDKKIGEAIEAKGSAELIVEKGKNYNKSIEKLKNLISSYEELKNKKNQHSKMSEKFKLVESNFKRIKAKYEEGNDSFRKGQAGLLADGLVEGLPCLVCGSKDHPNKAIKLKEIPTEDELKLIKIEYEKVSKERDTEITALTVLNNEINKYYKDVLVVNINQMIEILGENFLIDLSEDEQIKKILEKQDELDEIVNEERNEYKRLKVIFSTREQNEKEKERINKEIMAVNTDIENYNKFIKEESPKLSVSKERLKQIEDTVPVELRNESAIKSEIFRCEKVVKEIEKTINDLENKFKDSNERYTELNKTENIYEEELIKTEKNIEKINNEFGEVLKSQGFKDKEEYRLALCSEELELIDKKIKVYYEKLKSLEGRFEKDKSSIDLLEIKELHRVEENQNKLKNQYTELEKIEQSRIKDCNLFSNRSRNNKEVVKKIKDVVKRIGEKQKIYEKLAHLSNVANGDSGNLKKITFESYVLTSYFDEIIIEANKRLDKMTNGRFLLMRKDNLAKGNRKQGLELEIYDNNTGRERGVNSLSGGESFKTALCLALGLADVIQNYAGGISIDTMFLDEGFGTLDPQSLDSAIECLVNIQQGGRLVGIISHVDELKERIDAKLEIKVKDGEGSTAAFTIR